MLVVKGYLLLGILSFIVVTPYLATLVIPTIIVAALMPIWLVGGAVLFILALVRLGNINANISN